MSLSGMTLSTGGLCFLLLALSLTAANEATSLDLKYDSEPISGAVLDLQYPVQDMGGAPLQTGQRTTISADPGAQW